MSPRAAQLIASLTPKPLVGALVRHVYPRIEPELGLLASYVPQGGTAVDVGGWFGPWTQRLLGRSARVVTIEADSELARLLGRTFPTATVVHAAASDRDGETTLWSPPGGAIIGVSSVARSAGTGAQVPEIMIDSLNLDDVRFVKMDIEGHELAALRGAEKTIRRDLPVVLLELEVRHQPLEPVLDLMNSWGYQARVAPQNRWIPLTGFDLAAHQRTNSAHLNRSFPSRVLRPGPRYVNCVLFVNPGRA
ncbi:MAG: FkbM family methyltransferase [Streptosporangiaceae bacterium]